MKVALSGMVLGASMLGAHASSLDSTEYKFAGAGAAKLVGNTITYTPSDSEALVCVTGYGIDAEMANQGKARRDYTAAHVTVGSDASTKLAEYASGSVLTYYCGVSDGQGGFLGGLPGNPPVHELDGRIRVDLVGSCDKPALFVTADTTVDDSHYTGADDATSILSEYNAALNVKVNYQCKQPVDFAPGIDVALKFVQFQADAGETDQALIDKAKIIKDEIIRDIVSEEGEVVPLEAKHVTKLDLALSTTDGEIYTYTATKEKMEFALGTDRAHPDYYMSGGCLSSDDLCKGALRITLNETLSYRVDNNDKEEHDLATALLDDTKFKPLRKQFKQCSSTVINQEKLYTLYEACYPSQYEATEDVPGTLLVPLVCPFNGEKASSTTNTIQQCVDDGNDESEAFDNTCAGIEDKLKSRDPSVALSDDSDGVYEFDRLSATPQIVPDTSDKYKFSFKFDDTETGADRRFQTYSSLVATEITGDDKTLNTAQTSFSYTFAFTDSNAKTNLENVASDFFVKANVAGASWMKKVNLDDPTVTGIPAIATNLQLFGQVYKTCKKSEQAFSIVKSLTQTIHLKESGRFVQVDPCSDRFEYVRSQSDQTAAITVIPGIVGTEDENDVKQGRVVICKSTHDASDARCQEAGATSQSIPEKSVQDKVFALITNTCGNIKDEMYGGLVEFVEDYRAAAPVLCKGTCTSAVMHDLKLDWRVDFTVSSQAGSDHNKLVADQANSKWEDESTKSDGQTKYFTAKKFAYLVKPDATGFVECKADGSTVSSDTTLESLSYDAKDGGCLVHRQETNSDGSWGSNTTDSLSTGQTTASDMESWLTACGTATDSGAKALLVQRFSAVYPPGFVDRNTSMTTEHFCHLRELEVSLQTLVVGSVQQQIVMSQVSDPTSAKRLSTSIGTIRYEQNDDGHYRVRVQVDIESDGALDANGWTYDEAASSNSFFDSDPGDATIGYDAVNKKIEWITQYKNVCDDVQKSGILAVWNHVDGHTLAGKITRSNGAYTDGDDEVSFSFNFELEGDPCGENKGIAAGQVALDLYKVNPTRESGVALSDYVCASGNIEQLVSDGEQPHADGGFCGRIRLSAMGNFEFTILDTMVTRETPGSEPIFLCETTDDKTNDIACASNEGGARGQLFTFDPTDTNHKNTDVKADASGSKIIISDNVLKLNESDAFSTIKYTIFWKQELKENTAGTPTRRLLRSTHIFGASDHESVASLVVLPASAQIEDAVESLDASTEGEETTAAPDAAEEDSGLSGGAIAGIIAGGVVVAGGVAYVAMEALKPKDRRPKKREYTAVRRSERFSTMNF